MGWLHLWNILIDYIFNKIDLFWGDGTEQNKLIGMEALHHWFEFIFCYALHIDKLFYLKLLSWMVQRKTKMCNIYMLSQLWLIWYINAILFRIHDFKFFISLAAYFPHVHTLNVIFSWIRFICKLIFFQKGMDIVIIL